MRDNQDLQAFRQAGLDDDVYYTIGNYNLFMQCHSPNISAFRALPAGYSFRLCQRDELETWKRVVVEEAYISYITDYYNRVYKKYEDEFFRRCLFICDTEDTPIASSFIWRSYGQINTVGWFRVLPEHEGKGLGRALLSEIFRNAEYPVFLHTQPTSIRAIKLYSDFGFELITNPQIGHRKNDLAESLPFMQKIMPKNDFERLKFTGADDALLRAALLSESSEF